MSSAPEPGREAAAENVDGEGKAAKKAAETGPVEPVGEAEHGESVEHVEEPAKKDGAEEPAAAPVKSDAKPELEPAAAPEPVVRLAKAVEPEPEAASGVESVVEPAAVQPPDADRNAGRRRLKAALWPPRLSRGQLVVALLLFSLGLALAIQVRSTNDHHSQLRGARQEDLVRILDELDSRQQRLQQEKAELEQSLAKLENSSNQAKEAQEQTRKKATELGVLAGTVKATGPGIVLTVDDPQGQVKADMLLDTLQELRAAGAEAIQINDVRVVVNTYFTDVSGGGVQIDGKKVSQPYRFTVVGNPQDLTPALNIPGGVVRTLESNQARATITQQQKVVVDALVDLKTPQYAKPASK
ncbi:uncharacterized protein YlxW (UPF0749 family) [Kitasatospora sp. MAA19]|uniref:DUF881 domain-containing protein n=1 Tax=Kitasatospora sp. MAA19 TaxID=3035090 RepID=UPI00247420D5|nr:DUF881 domain-containing protein [Kitasatospora sp. MAA19]MDH6709701.1 uncharacterized protein YlxW (UPF0749 family) [Kitasatospora sp. MAA19]